MPTKTTYTATPWHVGPDGDTIHAGHYQMAIARVLMPSPGAWSQQVAEQLEGNAQIIVRAVNSHAQLMASLDALLDAISDLSDASRAELAGANDDAVSQAIAALAMARKGGQ